MPIGIGICHRAGRVRIPNRRHTIRSRHTEDDWEPKWYPYTRHIFDLEPLVVPVTCCCCCAGYSFVSARREVRRQAVVLGWAGELDRRLQGMYHLRWLLQCIWILKPRARAPTSVDGQTWWPGVCVTVLDVVGMVVVEEAGVLGNEALAVLSLHPVPLLAFNNFRAAHRLPLLLGVRANVNNTSPQAGMSPYGPTHDDREDVDGRDIFVPIVPKGDCGWVSHS